MKDASRQSFRNAAHVSGVATVKPKDYEAPAETKVEVEAENEYAAWALLRNTETPLHVGDLLECEGGLRICKYVGFEDARWFVPEPTQGSFTEPVAAPVVASERAAAEVMAQDNPPQTAQA
jgi:hypothetical protein